MLPLLHKPALLQPPAHTDHRQMHVRLLQVFAVSPPRPWWIKRCVLCALLSSSRWDLAGITGFRSGMCPSRDHSCAYLQQFLRIQHCLSHQAASKHIITMHASHHASCLPQVRYPYLTSSYLVHILPVLTEGLGNTLHTALAQYMQEAYTFNSSSPEKKCALAGEVHHFRYQCC